MRVPFIAKYYSLVTDDVIESKFEAESFEEAHKIAGRKLARYGAACEMDYDLYVDTLMMTRATFEDGQGSAVTFKF